MGNLTYDGDLYEEIMCEIQNFYVRNGFEADTVILTFKEEGELCQNKELFKYVNWDYTDQYSLLKRIFRVRNVIISSKVDNFKIGFFGCDVR